MDTRCCLSTQKNLLVSATFLSYNRIFTWKVFCCRCHKSSREKNRLQIIELKFMVFVGATRMICYQRSSSASFFIATPGGARHQKLCNFFLLSLSLTRHFRWKNIFPNSAHTLSTCESEFIAHLFKTERENRATTDKSRELPSTSPTTQQDGEHFSIMMDMAVVRSEGLS